MTRRGFIMLFCIVFVIISLSGCQFLQQYALDLGPDTEDSDTLPTLPVDSNDDKTSLIPVDVFTSYVEYTPPQISSDGSKILYRHSLGFQDSIIAEDWTSGEQTIVEWPSEAAGIPYFSWAPDSETILFFVDDMGDENYGLYTSNIYTGDTKTILEGGTNNCYYVANSPNNDKEIYIEKLNFDTEKYDLYLINYDTGALDLVMQNPGNITGYIFDYSDNLRIVTTTDEKAGEHVLLKKSVENTATSFAENDWEEILYWNYEDASSSGVWSIMPDGENMLYIDTAQTNTSSLYEYGFATGDSELVFNDPDYDLESTWTDLEINKVTAVTVYAQKSEWHVLDESFQDDYDALSAIGDDFDIISSSEDDAYWIVAYISDIKEEDYYAYDMKTNQLTFLYNAQPELGYYEFSPTEPFSYSTGDGWNIEGYATFPAGEGETDLPTVVLVHGGPWARDVWGFDSEVQFLASRGYLVLQVNFRGSTGYGKDFMLAGDKEWGGLMHQDVLDAVSYAVDQGWSDPDRIGVYGASYGGYEALISAAFSSDIFSCVVDAFGPSSLLTFVESVPPQWSVSYQGLIRSVGDPDTEADFMKERSPLYYADEIEIPLLIAQGENDVRVPQRESDQMVEALKEAGVPVTYMLFPDTGHGFSSDNQRQEFYSGMEQFFAENLGGRTE